MTEWMPSQNSQARMSLDEYPMMCSHHEIVTNFIGLQMRKNKSPFSVLFFVWQAIEFGNLKYSNFPSYYLPDLIISFRISSQNTALLALQNSLRKLLFQWQKENTIWITIASIDSTLNICQTWFETRFVSLI